MTYKVRLRHIFACGALAFLPHMYASGITNPSFVPCSPAGIELNSLLSPGAGCTIGGQFSATDFGFSASAGAPLTAADITLTPTFMTSAGNVIFIDFNFSTSLPGGFTNPTGSDIFYTFDYMVDPARPVINGASLTLDPGGLLTEDICAGGIYTPTMSGFTCTPAEPLIVPFQTILFVNDVPPTPQPTASTAFFPPNTFHVVDYHLVLDLPPGATAGGFDSGTVTALPPGTSGVPEPSSIALAASGLLGLLGLRSPKLRKVALKLLP